MIPTSIVATPAETRADLLKFSGRGYTVVRKILRQLPQGASTRVSVLGPMVTDRKRRSLQLYLFLLTVWPWLEKQPDQMLTAGVWARAMTTAKGRRWTKTNVSEAWMDLESRGLVKRTRLQRGLRVTPRREDGKADYTKPGTKKQDHLETYFILPPSLWLHEWFEELSMPGLAMLLIIAGETTDKDEVWLTNEGAAKWYGLSPRSVESGIENLRDHGLLIERVEWIKATLSDVGATKRHWYSLTGDFGATSRRKLQAAAKKELATRTKNSQGKPIKKAARPARRPAKAASTPRAATRRKEK